MSEDKWTAPPQGSPCWVEIPAVDVKACKTFYSSLFPSWKFSPATEKYTEDNIAMFSYGKPAGLHGGIIKVEASCKTGEVTQGVGVTIYHMVDSIEETKVKAESLGAKSISEKMPEGENGWFMYFKDVEGNRFGIYELKKGAC